MSMSTDTTAAIPQTKGSSFQRRCFKGLLCLFVAGLVLLPALIVQPIFETFQTSWGFQVIPFMVTDLNGCLNSYGSNAFCQALAHNETRATYRVRDWCTFLLLKRGHLTKLCKPRVSRSCEQARTHVTSHL